MVPTFMLYALRKGPYNLVEKIFLLVKYLKKKTDKSEKFLSRFGAESGVNFHNFAHIFLWGNALKWLDIILLVCIFINIKEVKW